MKSFVRFLIVATILITLWLVIELFLPIGCFAIAEEPREWLYVTATELNGRAEPDVRASREARFFRGDKVEFVSQHGDWTEVVGGETGTVWCKTEYLSSMEHPVRYKNTSGGYVNIRRTIEGKKVGRLKANREVNIVNIVNGWGYIKGDGWVDLSYFSEVETNE